MGLWVRHIRKAKVMHKCIRKAKKEDFFSAVGLDGCFKKFLLCEIPTSTAIQILDSKLALKIEISNVIFGWV